MDVVPVGPGFGAELRGVTLSDVANDDAAYHAARSISPPTPMPWKEWTRHRAQS